MYAITNKNKILSASVAMLMSAFLSLQLVRLLLSTHHRRLNNPIVRESFGGAYICISIPIPWLLLFGEVICHPQDGSNNVSRRKILNETGCSHCVTEVILNVCPHIVQISYRIPRIYWDGSFIVRRAPPAAGHMGHHVQDLQIPQTAQNEA